MTDLTPPERDDDILLLDALDGNAEALAIVETREDLAARLQQMQRNRVELRAATVSISPETRRRSIDAALGVFDNMAASAAADKAVRAVPPRRRLSRNLFRFLSVAAASVVAVVAVVAIGPNSGSGDSAEVANIATTDSEVTLSPADSDVVANARESLAAGDAGALSENFSAPMTAAPATTTAAARDVPTAEAPAESLATTTTSNLVATSQAEAIDSEPLIDNAILECATQTEFAVDSWISSSPGDESVVSGQRLTSFVVLTDDGFEIDVVLDIAECEFVSVSDPRAPEPAGQ